MIENLHLCQMFSFHSFPILNVSINLFAQYPKITHLEGGLMLPRAPP